MAQSPASEGERYALLYFRSPSVAVIGDGESTIDQIPNIRAADYRRSIMQSRNEESDFLLEKAADTPFVVLSGYDFLGHWSVYVISPISIANQQAPFIRLKLKRPNSERFWEATEVSMLR
jgi:hypothetical protein